MMKGKKEITEKEALNKLAALCSRAEHCSFEMRRKMTLWGLAMQTHGDQRSFT